MTSSSSLGTTYKFDVMSFARNVLLEVDGIRSYLPSVSDDSQQVDNRPVESRVNAFFRLVGLPMFVSISPDNDQNNPKGAAEAIITPGFVQAGRPEGIIENSKSVQISDPITGQTVDLKTILFEREQTLLDLEKKVGTPDRDARRVEAFYNPLGLKLDEKTEDRFDHIIFKRTSPFIVSYSEIYPGQNELSKPFLANPEHGRPPPDSTPIKRPFIETVIRMRTTSLEGGNQGQEDYLATTRAQLAQISPEAANMLPSQPSLYQAFIIDQMLGSIEQFADIWVNLQRRRERFTKDGQIILKPKTSSAKQNSFGKQSNFALSLQLKDNTSLGQRRAELNREIVVSEALIGLLPTDDITSLGGNKTKNIMPNALTNSFISVLRQPIEQQRKKLDEVNRQLEDLTQRADRLRLELEMMTGEFSGLSIPDVVFTILGLFLISTDDLIGMLDSSTRDEMKKDKILETIVNEASPTDTIEAVDNLYNKVFDLYETLKVAIGNRLNRDRRTSKNSQPKVSEIVERIIDSGQPENTEE